MNLIAVHGRLTRDPETKTLDSGTTVTSFTVAVDREYKDKNGERPTDFFDCTAWRERGETIAKYFSKGQEIVVRGAMESRKYEDKDGNKRTAWEINVSGFDFCGKKENGGTSGGGGGSGFSEVSDNDDGDLPF